MGRKGEEQDRWTGRGGLRDERGARRTVEGAGWVEPGLHVRKGDRVEPAERGRGRGRGAKPKRGSRAGKIEFTGSALTAGSDTTGTGAAMSPRPRPKRTPPRGSGRDPDRH